MQPTAQAVGKGTKIEASPEGAKETNEEREPDIEYLAAPYQTA
jgi:hypothetical protein